jgi:hypothetical protein
MLKTFKTHCSQQHWLNLKKIMAPLMKNEEKISLLTMMVINRFERSYRTFKGGGGKNSLSLKTLG